MKKVCNKCSEEKEIEKFTICNGVYKNPCKECRNKSRRTGNPVGNKGIFRSRGKGGRYYYKFRAEILERDGHKCTRCGSEGTLHVHHIVPWNDSVELRFEPTNLVTLCGSCHAIVEPKFTKGKQAWNKGLKGIYSDKTKALWSEQRKGVEAWNKGLKGYRAGRKSPHSEETKMKIAETKKNIPWSEKRIWAQKQSESKKGKPWTEKRRNAQKP